MAEPLRPNFWKVPNDNQYRNGYTNRLGAWRTAAANRKIDRVTAAKRGRHVEVVVESTLPVGKSKLTIKYLIMEDIMITKQGA